GGRERRRARRQTLPEEQPVHEEGGQERQVERPQHPRAAEPAPGETRYDLPLAPAGAQEQNREDPAQHANQDQPYEIAEAREILAVAREQPLRQQEPERQRAGTEEQTSPLSQQRPSLQPPTPPGPPLTRRCPPSPKWGEAQAEEGEPFPSRGRVVER